MAGPREQPGNPGGISDQPEISQLPFFGAVLVQLLRLDKRTDGLRAIPEPYRSSLTSKDQLGLRSGAE
jgi:hypothetical protein